MKYYAKNIFVAAVTGIMLLSSSTAFSVTESLRLHTTTSTRDSGLMAVLIPAFEKKTGIYIDLKTAGTGKAIRAARLGKTDLLWIHAPEAEKKFIRDGFSTSRTETMYNDFVLVGPDNDPAGIKTAKSIVEALQRIYKKEKKFVSRGDDSGTNKKELLFWKKAKISPFGGWYYETGAGMKKSIIKASDIGAYTLTDRGTWLANKHLFKLSILFQGDPDLINTYSLLPINPQRFPNVNSSAAKKFINFVTKGEGRNIIKAFTINKKPLFKIRKNK